MSALSLRTITVVATLLVLALLFGCAAERPHSGVSGNRFLDARSDAAGVSSDAGSGEAATETEESKMNLEIGGQSLTATLVENSSTDALRQLLAKGPLTIHMSDYANMEKVGELGARLPTNDEQINTGPGDLILYQGSRFVIYYARNSWSLTRLGKIDGVDPAELKRLLGNGDVSVTLSSD